MAPCHILQALKQGDMILWICHEDRQIKAGMVLEVNQFPTKKVVFVVILVGQNMDEWVDEMEAMLIRYRDAIEADCIECSARKGLVRKLMQRNWRVKAHILEAPDGRKI